MTKDADVHVSIRQLTRDEAKSVITDRRPESGWATDFPAEGDVTAAKYAQFVPTSKHEPWFAPWFVIADGLIVGMLGFKGEPLANVLEVGYSIVPSAQGRGVATRALSELLDLVRGRGITVIAEAATWNAPSEAILRRLHFIETGRRYDGDDGDVVVWRLPAE